MKPGVSPVVAQIAFGALAVLLIGAAHFIPKLDADIAKELNGAAFYLLGMLRVGPGMVREAELPAEWRNSQPG